MSDKIPHFINGKPVLSHERYLSVYNPATGDVTGQLGVADSKLVQKAVFAAKEAFFSWSQTPALKRARILFQFKNLLEQNSEKLAKKITEEHGKTLTDARGSIQRGLDVVEFACGIPVHLKGSYSENIASDMDSYSFRQPLGVCVGITPFNFPAMIALWMFPISIACGNTFILKPSEKDPSCAILIAELAHLAGVPAGVINVLQGDKETVDALLLHPDVKAVSFVGSTAVAKQVYQTATAQGKRVQAFGGAKNHCIVMGDADIDQVSDAIVGAAFGSAGERCMAISAVLAVGDALANPLVEKIAARIRTLKIGDGLTDVEMGPLITEAHLAKVKSYLDIGLKEGATLVVDGRTSNMGGKGFFLAGSLFDHVEPHMQIYQTEIFGPILVVLRVKSFEEALKLVNDHPLGNGVALFTRDGYTARAFVESVQVGMVGINVPIPVPIASHSFGGWKQSFFGDIGMHGMEGVNFFTKLKTVTQRWPKLTSGSEFNMPTH